MTLFQYCILLVMEGVVYMPYLGLEKVPVWKGRFMVQNP